MSCPVDRQQQDMQYNLDGRKGDLKYPVVPGVYECTSNPYLKKRIGIGRSILSGCESAYEICIPDISCRS